MGQGDDMRVNVFELTWAKGGKMAAKEYVVPADEGETFDFPAKAEDDVRALNKAKCAWQLVFMYQTTLSEDGGRLIPSNSAVCSYTSKPSTWMSCKEREATLANAGKGHRRRKK